MASGTQQRKRVSKTASKKTNSKKTNSNKTSAKVKTPMRREVKIFIYGFISLVFILCFYSPVFGPFGSIVLNIFRAFLGNSAYAFPIIITAFLMHSAIKGSVGQYRKTYLCLFAAAVLFSMLATIESSSGAVDYLNAPTPIGFIEQLVEGGTSGADGGIIGALGIPVKSFFGEIGSKIIIVFAIILLLSVAAKFLPIIWLINGVKKLIDFASEKFEERRQNDEEIVPEEGEAEKPVRIKKEKGDYPKQVVLDLDKTEDKNFRLPKQSKAKKEAPPLNKAEEENIVTNNFDDFDIKIYLPSNNEEENPSAELSAELPSAENISSPPAFTAASPKAEKKEPNTAIELTEEDFIAPTKPYEFPPISLLDQSYDRGGAQKGSDLRQQAKALVETLRSFGVEAKVLEVNKGPTVTRFELQPATGVKVSKIVNLSDDIALNLAALSVRIEAPIPGKSAIGIEIPNTGNSIVRLREVIDSDEFKNFKAKTAFALGKDISGVPVVTDISKMPHALIAGTTGSGKSVCINSLITSIIYKADPGEVKFIMIDPKVVELSVYNGIPHLLIPVVTDPRKAAGALNWAVQEMTKRYKMFADNNVRDIKGYNDIAGLNGEKKLEQIIIIVDELADLMMVAPRDVEDAICRLAQMARAAGMHLVIATQSPRVDVITGLIKTNIPSRIAFAVSSQIDSRIILDMGGAEKLLGKGDMLFLPMGASKPIRIQGAFISDKEVEKVVEFVRQTDIKYDEDVLEKIESGVSGEKEPDGGDADELLPQAIEIVVEAGQASASLLQRRLKVGYSRAGRLIDQLEARGIIGPHEGAKPRAVLMSRAEYAEMTMQTE